MIWGTLEVRNDMVSSQMLCGSRSSTDGRPTTRSWLLGRDLAPNLGAELRARRGSQKMDPPTLDSNIPMV